MAAYFDSPATIRGKIKEFRQGTFGGVNKQDVVNYLSVLAEQQGVMIKLLKDNNVPLLVDEAYETDEQFSQPSYEIPDGLGSFENSETDIAENAIIIAQLKEELEILQAQVNKQSNDGYINGLPDFDSEFNVTSSSNEEDINVILSEKDAYIQELEKQLSLSDSELANIDVEVVSNYENRIAELERQLDDSRNGVSDNTEPTQDKLDFDEFELEDTDNLATFDESAQNMIKTLEEQLATVSKERDTCINQIAEITNENTELKEKLVDDTKTSVLQTAQNEFETSILDIDSTNSLEDMKNTIEMLESEILKISNEKRKISENLEEVSIQLERFTSYTDADGELTMLDPISLAEQNKEVLALKESLEIEKEDLNLKLTEIAKKEELIEKNKHLLSDEYVQSVSAKEAEVDMLRKQMDKMLLVAQRTAEETEKEAKSLADTILLDAKTESESILAIANENKKTLEEQATQTLIEAKSTKDGVETEMEELRLTTRNESEQIIIDAQSAADTLLIEATEQAKSIQKSAENEVSLIMEAAEEKISALEKVMSDKQKEIENAQRYYLNIKKEGITSVKKLYQKLENIIYEDDTI